MKQFLTFLIFISSCKGFAQKDSRVVFGPMLSLTSTSLNAKPSIGNIDPQKAMGIGLFARLRIMMLYAEFEGGFTSLKSKSELTLPSGLNSQSNYTLNGWDINSYIGWRIFKMEDIGNVRVFIGYTLKDISKISIRSDLPNLQNLNFDSKFEGFIFGAGVDIWKLAFNVKFTRGFGDIVSSFNQSIINNYSTFSVGYKF
jgi:hypothetical protein